MKPTSVIFLIVAVLLACVGFLLCMTATSLATEQGIGLFEQIGDEDDNYVSTEKINEEDLKKIVVKVGNVNVNVIGGAEEARIELVNFMNNSYQIQAGRSTLQISDNSGISGIVDIDNFKINFHGFRDYLHYISDYVAGNPQKEQILNIYLTDTADLVNFNITMGSGDLTVSNMTADCDYKIVLENGVVEIDRVTTDSSIQIESTVSSNIEIKDTVTDELRIMSPKSECFIEISDTTFSRAMYVEAKSGDIVYDRVESDFAGLDVKFEALGIPSAFSEQTIPILTLNSTLPFQEKTIPWLIRKLIPYPRTLRLRRRPLLLPKAEKRIPRRPKRKPPQSPKISAISRMKRKTIPPSPSPQIPSPSLLQKVRSKLNKKTEAFASVFL